MAKNDRPQEGPEPARPEPKKAESPKPSGYAAQPEPGRPGAQAYTPRPVFEKPKPKGRWAAIGAGVLAVALAGTFMTSYLPGDPAPPGGPAAVADAKAEKVLRVGMNDLDTGATDRARRLLMEEKSPLPAADPRIDRDSQMVGDGTTAGSAASEAAAPARDALPVAPPAAPSAAPSGSPSPIPPSGMDLVKREPTRGELAALPAPVKDAIKDGRMGLFTLHILDWCMEDGDVVALSVDGMPIGQVMITHAGADITIPLKQGQSQTLTVTAVHDGGGGVTFGASSSLGDMRTRSMAVGESETWIISFE